MAEGDGRGSLLLPHTIAWGQEEHGDSPMLEMDAVDPADRDGVDRASVRGGREIQAQVIYLYFGAH
jgi:hypothetical protein